MIWERLTDMTRRKAALLGTKTGPWVPTRDLRDPVVQISGLGKGIVMLFAGHQPDDANTFHCQRLSGDGIHIIGAFHWVKLQVLEGDHRKVCCTIMSRKAA